MRTRVAEYGQLRAWLLVRMMEEKMTPGQVAAVLEDVPIRDRMLAAQVADEAARYRAMGETWRPLLSNS